MSELQDLQSRDSLADLFGLLTSETSKNNINLNPEVEFASNRSNG